MNKSWLGAYVVLWLSISLTTCAAESIPFPGKRFASDTQVKQRAGGLMRIIIEFVEKVSKMTLTFMVRFFFVEHIQVT